MKLLLKVTLISPERVNTVAMATLSPTVTQMVLKRVKKSVTITTTVTQKKKRITNTVTLRKRKSLTNTAAVTLTAIDTVIATLTPLARRIRLRKNAPLTKRSVNKLKKRLRTDV